MEPMTYIVIGLILVVVFAIAKKMIKFAIYLSIFIILCIVIYKLILTL